MRFKVYIWEVFCLDYPLDVLISWICNQSGCNWFGPYLYACVTVHDTVFDICFFKSVLSIHVCLLVHAAWLHFYHLMTAFWLPWTCMSRSLSLDWSGALRWRPSLPRGASRPAVAPLVPDFPDRLAGFPLAREHPFCPIHILNYTFAPPGDVIYL